MENEPPKNSAIAALAANAPVSNSRIAKMMRIGRFVPIAPGLGVGVGTGLG